MSSASASPAPRDLFYYDVNGCLQLDFHPGQQAVMESVARFIFMLAGTQGGKTSLGPWWLWQEIGRTCIHPEYLEKYKGRYHEMPVEGWMDKGGDFLAVTSNYKLFKMKMLPELLRVFVKILGIGRYWAGDRVIELINPHTREFGAKDSLDIDNMWGRIILGSARAGKAAKSGTNVGVSSLEATTAKAAWIDECGQDDFTIATWDSIKARLSLWRGRILGTTTLYNHGWMKSEIYDKWQKGNKNIDVVQFDSVLNPSFPIEEYEDARDNMPLWKFRMRYQGQYDRPAGAIFGDFDEVSGIVPRTGFFDTTPIIIGIDPGGVNTATVYLALQKELGRIYLFEEHLEGNLTTADHAQNIKNRAKKHYKKVRVVGGAKSEIQFRKDMRKEGVFVVEPPVWEVEAGLDRIIRLMKMKKLVVADTCVHTLAQIREYSRKVDSLGEPMEGTENIEDKAKFHMIDALRYACTLITVRSPPKGREGGKKAERGTVPLFGDFAGVEKRRAQKGQDPRDPDGGNGRHVPLMR